MSASELGALRERLQKLRQQSQPHAVARWSGRGRASRGSRGRDNGRFRSARPLLHRNQTWTGPGTGAVLKFSATATRGRAAVARTWRRAARLRQRPPMTSMITCGMGRPDGEHCYVIE